MNTKILNILCEGQTEERFANLVLKPYLKNYGIIVKCRLLITSKRKNAAGGIISYTQVKGDLQKWMREVSGRNSETNYFSTMFDFYALPNDFPGYNAAVKIQDDYLKVETLEKSFSADMCCNGFVPYIQLHEFEALLFTDIEKLADKYPDSRKNIQKLAKILPSFSNNPELINTKPETAPSRRIIQAVEKNYHYNKPQGAESALAIGLHNILKMCRHFREWTDKLISL